MAFGHLALLVAFGHAANAQLPDPGMDVVPGHTALLITDPPNDFLSPDGVTWGVVGESVTENNTVEHIDALFESARGAGMLVFISPHYYYPTDHGWLFEGALEKLMHAIKMFDRKGPPVAGGVRRLRAGLARTVQEVHRTRRDHRRQPAQGVRA